MAVSFDLCGKVCAPYDQHHRSTMGNLHNLNSEANKCARLRGYILTHMFIGKVKVCFYKVWSASLDYIVRSKEERRNKKPEVLSSLGN